MTGGATGGNGGGGGSSSGSGASVAGNGRGRLSGWCSCGFGVASGSSAVTSGAVATIGVAGSSR